LRLLLFVGFSHLAWKATRNTNIFAIVSGFVGCENVSEALESGNQPAGCPSVRRRIWAMATVLAGLILAVGGASAQAPINDDFENAADLGSGPAGTILTNNLEATRQSGESLIYPTAGGSSIWFKWTAPVDCVVFFDTTNSEIDTVLGVYTGFAVDNLTLIAKNDNFGFINANTLVQSSRVTFKYGRTSSLPGGASITM